MLKLSYNFIKYLLLAKFGLPEVNFKKLPKIKLKN